MVQPILIPDASAEPAAYVRALLDVLGDRDPLEVYDQTRDAIRGLCSGLDKSAWTRPMAPGEWSAYQIVGHLLDVDIVYGFRWRLVLTEEVPSYPGYDERAWARLPRPGPDALLAAFQGLRTANIALVESIEPRDRQRQGVHAEQGIEDIDRMIRKIAGHDLAHANQLERTIEAAMAARPGNS
jgi:hypothetical protein